MLDVAWLTSGGTAPKFQAQLVAAPPVEASLKETPNGAQPAIGVAAITPTGACENAVHTDKRSKTGIDSKLLFNG